MEQLPSSIPQLPNRVTQTEYLKTKDNPNGYWHVKQNAYGKYYCYYRGVNTGLHETAQLAAFVLHKLCTASNISIVLAEREIPDALPYPECSKKIPEYIDVDALKYLEDKTFRSGYRDVTLLNTRESRTFSCVTIRDGISYRTKQFRTPAEAAWAIHTNTDVKICIAYELTPELVEEEFGPIDMKAIKTLSNPKSPTGYHHVYSRGPKYNGAYTVDGKVFYTKTYRFREEAAWAVHNHLLAVGDRRGTQATKAAEQVLPITASELIKSIRNEYRIVIGETTCNGVAVEHADF